MISQAQWGGLRVQQTQIHLSTSGLAFKLPRLLKPPAQRHLVAQNPCDTCLHVIGLRIHPVYIDQNTKLPPD